jgi:hypothetical protein
LPVAIVHAELFSEHEKDKFCMILFNKLRVYSKTVHKVGAILECNVSSLIISVM